MVEALGHTIFNLNPRAPSIDTWLHGFVPYTHVDHVHSDAVIAIAASADQVRLTEEIFGGELGYLPWQRPGIDLGIKLGRMAEENPKLKGVVLGQHGLFTWAETAKDCYLLTLEMINRAAVWLDANVKRPVFGGEKVASPGGFGSEGSGPAVDAADPGAHFRRRAYGGPFHRRAGGAGVCELSFAFGPGADGDILPRPFPADEDQAFGGACGCRCQRAGRADRGVPGGLRGLLRPLQAPELPRDARPECGDLPGAGRGDDVLRQGQGDGPGLGRVLRQRDQRDAGGFGGFGISGPARAGGVRHRILASGRGQAAADAEAEGDAGAGGLHHRRCGRDRVGLGRTPAARRLQRGAGRH